MSGFELLEKSIKSSATSSFLIGGMFLLMGLGLGAGGAAQLVAGEFSSGGFMAVMGLLSMVGAWMMVQDGRSMRPARGAPIYKVFEDEPERIAWAHGVVGKSNGVRVHLITGQEHTLPANAADSKALLMFIHERAPRAILGYGKEQEVAYRERVKARRAAT